MENRQQILKTHKAKINKNNHYKFSFYSNSIISSKVPKLENLKYLLTISKITSKTELFSIY